MPPKILIVDRNEAFATMLEQMLVEEDRYQVRVARSGSAALAIMRQEDLDLTIIDMDLDPDDIGYRDLILDARQHEPTMRMMLIPLMGGGVPPEAEQLDIQGVLSKPFFADDLLPSIKTALAAKVKSLSVRNVPLNETQPSSIQAVPPPRPARPAPQAPADLLNTLSELAHETNAEAILLLSLAGGEARVMANASSLDDARLGTLTDLSMAIVQASRKTNQVWGKPNEPFKHYMFESDSLRFYMMALPGDRLLTIVTPITTALGTIRHNLRRTARNLSAMT